MAVPVMAGLVPAIPILFRAAPHLSRGTGTGPVMMGWGTHSLSFPAGDGESHRRGRESMAPRLIVDPLPSLRSPGMTPFPVMAGLVPAIPLLKSAAPRVIGITGTRTVMTWWSGHCRSPPGTEL